jgi:hypothetical protein
MSARSSGAYCASICGALRTVLLGFFIAHIVEISIATACAGSSVAC